MSYKTVMDELLLITFYILFLFHYYIGIQLVTENWFQFNT